MQYCSDHGMRRGPVESERLQGLQCRHRCDREAVEGWERERQRAVIACRLPRERPHVGWCRQESRPRVRQAGPPTC